MLDDATYQTMTEQLMDGLIMIDDHDKICLFNRAATRILGYSSEDVLGQDVAMLMSASGAAKQMKHCVAQDTNHTGRRIETKCICKDGKTLSVRFAVNALEDSKGKPMFCALISDVSSEKQAAEDMRRVQAETLYTAKLASVGELAAGAAHEINNPLTGIINYAQILMDLLELNEQQTAMLQKIVDGGMRISEMVNNLRKLARGTPDTRGKVQMADIIEAGMQLVGAQMRNHGVKVVIDLANDLPSLYCNSGDIQQLCMNLMTNAREALEEKYKGAHEGSHLNITGRVIERHDNSYIQMVFHDLGCGMSEAVIKKLSTPFFTTKNNQRNAGLGLYSGFAIVAAHGGTLVFESQEGEFTKAVVELPIQSTSDQEGASTHPT